MLKVKNYTQNLVLKIRVLLVDDHKTALEVLETYMVTSIFHMILVQSGEEALNYIDNAEYDLILLIGN